MTTLLQGRARRQDAAEKPQGPDFVKRRKLDFVGAAKLLLLGRVRGEEVDFRRQRVAFSRSASVYLL
jgi:hypothetical protein